MKKFLLTLAVGLVSLPIWAGVEALSPAPKSITVGSGAYTLPTALNIGYTADMPADMVAEVSKFAQSLKTSTGINATASAGQGNISVSTNAALAAEGYNLAVTADGVSIEAATPAGLYYAFQSVKKLLPTNVALSLPASGNQTYELPAVTINDEPRFEYRGFMLDVSRHFFTAQQVMKMLDIMSVYKMNRFHWHLTDDQGWRLPVAKWPKLTVEGAINHNVLHSDFTQGRQWRESDETYGPYAYTADEIRQVVEYAKERHIEIIPEIDMPGHMVAAIHAYPELSTSDSYDHAIWNTGGVSKDVLDVSNPRVMEFMKDVVDALADYFPYSEIHLGGDECPTDAWKASAACQAFKAEQGIATDGGLQSWFFKQIADYAKETHNKTVCAWNEIITNGEVDMAMVKSVSPRVYCWIGGEGKANDNNLKYIYTGFNGGFYINRSYVGIDNIGAGRDGSLDATLSINFPANASCTGVQGTFWTEQVDRPEDLEYLALPRLMGIAERGWNANHTLDTDEVRARFAQDIELLTLGGYSYGAQQLVAKEYFRPQPDTWYTLTANATDARTGRAFTLQDGKLMGVALTGDDNQLFKFVENPANPEEYAIVCKAQPQGSVNPTPTAVATSGRWNYTTTLTYGFTLDKNYYGTTDDTFRWAIKSTGSNGQYMNFSMAGQGYAINVYGDPNDGKGGLITFTEVPETVDPVDPVDPETIPEANVYYRLHTRFNGDQNQARYGSVIELMRDNSKGNNCKEDRLWSNQPVEKSADNYMYQLFKFEADPAGSGHYAMVCMAKPQGSVNSTPSVSINSNTARWDYDNATKHYGFRLVSEHQGVDDNNQFYSAITSKDAASGWYMNTAAGGQGFAIHLWNNPADQNAGLYNFVAMEKDPSSAIEAVEAPETQQSIFDLQGRKLSRPIRGINIINGQKVIR